MLIKSNFIMKKGCFVRAVYSGCIYYIYFRSRLPAMGMNFELLETYFLTLRLEWSKERLYNLFLSPGDIFFIY